MQRKPQTNNSSDINIDNFLNEARDSKINSSPEVKQPEASINLDKIIQKEKSGKAKTYYFDSDVLKLVSTTAKKKGISESKLINGILRHVLSTQ